MANNEILYGTWYFNETIDITSLNRTALNFTCYSQGTTKNYYGIGNYGGWFCYFLSTNLVDHIEPYQKGKWIDEECRTIKISTAENATVLKWLQANAVKLADDLEYDPRTKKQIFTDTLNELSDVINNKAGTTGKKVLSQIVETAKTIETGITPTGTYEVTDNGEYDITEYAKVNVNVASSGGGDTTQEDGIITRTITEYSNDRITTVGSYAFYQCVKLLKLDLPNVETVNIYGCDGCTGLETLNLPNVKKINNYGFRNNKTLKKLDLPNVEEIWNYTFESCSALEIIYIPKIKTITSRSFRYCKQIKALIIEQTDSVCTLNNINVFEQTFDYSKGAIFVPDSLLEDYKAATNWSTYADYIKPLSEYVEE
jgi:hypothetical protein